ncbi:MAG: hypothetical protein ACXVAU_05285 [Mucilaginibacter sp.]
MMNRWIVYSLAIGMCCMAGCVKERKIPVYLLKQVIVDDRVEGKALDTTAYTYDDQNRITTITDGAAPHKISFGLTYDSQGRVNTAKKFNNSGALVIEFDFYYTPNASGYYFYGVNHSPSDTAVFTFNSNNQVTRIQTKRSGWQLFTYDSRGNVITSDGFGADGSNNLFDNITYSYDTRRNPFSDTTPGNLFFMYVAFTDPSTLINNVVVKDADTYSYTYNNDGFPLKATVNTGTAIIPIYYNYTLK